MKCIEFAAPATYRIAAMMARAPTTVRMMTSGVRLGADPGVLAELTCSS
jgi:hypothetical protein